MPPEIKESSSLQFPVLINQKKKMTIISIDNKEYEFESLSAETRAQFVSLQFTDQEIAQLQARLAAMQTARNAYAQALNGLLAEKDSVIQ